jgi:hypothetical protein
MRTLKTGESVLTYLKIALIVIVRVFIVTPEQRLAD